MLLSLGLGIFLFLATSSVHAVGQHCRCSGLPPDGLQVNCSFLNLKKLPHLPPDTTELHMHNNELTTVLPGMFDRLVRLKKVSLTGNPFHCDCRIQYLRNWLLKNRHLVSKEPTCATPGFVAQIAISKLSDDFFASCSGTRCTGGAYNIIMGVMLCFIIALLLWSLRLAKKSTFTLYIDERHAGFEADSLRSLKPKHRRRLNTLLSENSGSLTWTEDLERPLFNPEILPQVLDVLHKKHNIKIKAT